MTGAPSGYWEALLLTTLRTDIYNGNNSNNTLTSKLERLTS
jgi:hypothetical protein